MWEFSSCCEENNDMNSFRIVHLYPTEIEKLNLTTDNHNHCINSNTNTNKTSQEVISGDELQLCD